MNWLAVLFKTVILDFLWRKLSEGVGRLIRRWIELRKHKEIMKRNEELGAAAEAIAEEIKKLIREGKEVPDELYQKLAEANRRIIDHTNNT